MLWKYIKKWALEGWEKGKAKYYPIEPINEDILDEIALLEGIIERRQQAGYLLELELKTATGKRKISIINQLNTMDKQTYKDRQRLYKLMNP